MLYVKPNMSIDDVIEYFNSMFEKQMIVTKAVILNTDGPIDEDWLTEQFDWYADKLIEFIRYYNEGQPQPTIEDIRKEFGITTGTYAQLIDSYNFWKWENFPGVDAFGGVKNTKIGTPQQIKFEK